MRLIVHANNIHQGGGLELLLELIDAFLFDHVGEIICNIDSRIELPNKIIHNADFRRVEPSIWGRLKSELWLRNNVQKNDIVLCFGNLPPIFNLLGEVKVFVQNRYLVEDVSLSDFSFNHKLRITAEKFWFRALRRNVNEYIVQTPSMKSLVVKKLDVEFVHVKTLPFVSAQLIVKKNLNICASKNYNQKSDFIYVASGEPHKNHKSLIGAWCLLAEVGIFPSLRLTISKKLSKELCLWIEDRVNRYGLKVDNVGFLPKHLLYKAYSDAGALIFPSNMESFGIPLLEAKQLGLPIIASELDYVRDLVKPEQTFDPNSEKSIAHAVKRYLCKDDLPLELLDGVGFLDKIIQNNS